MSAVLWIDSTSWPLSIVIANNPFTVIIEFFSIQIPEWAQRTNLNRALEMQFADGPQRMDPDKIFGEVETCNLEEIFGDVKTKKRYHKRTSSGNWSKDHVTVAEKLAYKRAMGYDKM